MSTIKRIIEETDTADGKAFDYVIQVLIVVSLISFSMETLPDLQDGTRAILRYIEIFTVAVFTVEYIARIVVATDKPAYIFSFFGILDYSSDHTVLSVHWVGPALAASFQDASAGPHT